MSGEIGRTDITYDDRGRIIQLDSYVPEVKPGEVAVGIDLAMFTLSHPLRGGVAVHQILDDPIGNSDGYMIPCLSREDDYLESDGDLQADELADSDDILVINQHIGSIGVGGIAVAVCTFDMTEAPELARMAVEPALVLSSLMEGMSNN